MPTRRWGRPPEVADTSPPPISSSRGVSPGRPRSLRRRSTEEGNDASHLHGLPASWEGGHPCCAGGPRAIAGHSGSKPPSWVTEPPDIRRWPPPPHRGPAATPRNLIRFTPPEQALPSTLHATAVVVVLELSGPPALRAMAGAPTHLTRGVCKGTWSDPKADTFSLRDTSRCMRAARDHRRGSQWCSRWSTRTSCCGGRRR